MKSIIFVPSNEINVHKNRALLNALEDAEFEILVLCLDELLSDKFSIHKSVVNSGFKYLCISGKSFCNNRHWTIQSFQKRLILKRLNVLFENYSPSLLLTAYDGDVVPFWVSKEFKRRKLPIVVVPDGLVLPESQDYSVSLFYLCKRLIGKAVKHICGVGDSRGSSKPDYVLLPNFSGIDVFTEFGISPENIQVVGSPEYEKIANHLASNRSEAEKHSHVYTDLSLNPGRTFALYAPQVNLTADEEQERQLVLTMAAAVKQCNSTLVVKFHHRSHCNIDDWVNWRASVNLTDKDVVFTDRHLSALDILNKASLCITTYSTVGLEALFCMTPLIVIKYVNAPYQLPYAERYDCAVDVHDSVQLKDTIIQLLSDTSRREMLVQKGIKALRTEVSLDNTSSTEKSIALIRRALTSAG